MSPCAPIMLTHRAGTSTMSLENLCPYFCHSPGRRWPRGCGTEDAFNWTGLRSTHITAEVLEFSTSLQVFHCRSRVRHWSKSLSLKTGNKLHVNVMEAPDSFLLPECGIPKGLKPPTRLLCSSSKMMKKESNHGSSVILWSIIHYLCFKLVSNVCHLHNCLVLGQVWACSFTEMKQKQLH